MHNLVLVYHKGQQPLQPEEMFLNEFFPKLQNLHDPSRAHTVKFYKLLLYNIYIFCCCVVMLTLCYGFKMYNKLLQREKSFIW